MKAWESHLHGSTNVPTFDSLSTFLETEYRICENSNNPIEITQNVTPSCSSSNATTHTTLRENSNKNSKENSNTTYRDHSNTSKGKKQ